VAGIIGVAAAWRGGAKHRCYRPETFASQPSLAHVAENGENVSAKTNINAMRGAGGSFA